MEENLKRVLRKESKDDQIAKALKVPAHTFKKQIKAVLATRNKIMQVLSPICQAIVLLSFSLRHHLRLVLFSTSTILKILV
jgi:hypothetical protein